MDVKDLSDRVTFKPRTKTCTERAWRKKSILYRGKRSREPGPLRWENV